MPAPTVPPPDAPVFAVRAGRRGVGVRGSAPERVELAEEDPFGAAEPVVAPAAGSLPGRPSAVGLDELADLLSPRAAAGSPPDAPEDPEDLRAAFLDRVDPALAEEPRRELLAAVLGRLARDGGAPAWCRDVARVLDWGAAELGHPALEPTGEPAAAILERLEPPWARSGRRQAAHSPLPARTREPTPFAPEDLAVLDRVFQYELPSLLADRGGAWREGQHRVARRVAETLGDGELLLVHAPTGTGKTLAYLVPLLLWSFRHGLRTGVSTYTRALQEQAMGQDLPRALAALERAGAAAARARAAVLKGRENYLCWRALITGAPEEGDSAEAAVAWLRLALFGLDHATGDLDGFPRRSPCRGLDARKLQRETDALVWHARASTGCCLAPRDRAACAAHQARARAERSHVVITNHSLALARRELFHHGIFDECEHLHDQAKEAWSSDLGLRRAHGRLARLGDAERPEARAPLDRIGRAVLPGSRAAHAHAAAAAALAEARAGLAELEQRVRAFETWRRAELRQVEARDEHTLFRRYLEAPDGEPLLAARERWARALAELEVALTGALAELGTLPLRGAGRLRRALERGRAELGELGEALAAWIPMTDGRPTLDPTRLHDVETDGRGERHLTARVLLPQEVLGRHVLPELGAAAFLSATTWLRGGFESAMAYLGLDRAAEPAQDEEREPREVAALRAPSPFDHSRTLVCVPSDAPLWAGGRQAFHEFTRDFVARLGERTRGRLLVLFTNAEDLARAGRELEGFFHARDIPFWWQGMPGLPKERISELFRDTRDSVLMGLDTFWYGADFPGPTLEYLVIVRLPYGVPDRYHHAQCALLGRDLQRRAIYLPRALAKFRQGFGRLMRRETDRGAVFLLDRRILDGRHRVFLGELPLQRPVDPTGEWLEQGARLLAAPAQDCLEAAEEHMRRTADSPAAGAPAPPAGGGPLDGLPGGPEAAP